MLWKKATLLGLAGFALGVLVGIGFTLAGSSGGLKEALPHLLMGGIQGAAAMGGSVMYEIESWSIARATATHFLLVFGLFFLISFTMGWFRPDDPALWIFVAAMAAGYVLIWLIQYLACRRKIRQMNDDLRKWKTGKKED